MSRFVSSSLRGLALVVAVGIGSGCSILSNDGLNLDYSFTPLDFQEKFEAVGGTFPSVPCGSDAMLCETAAAQLGDPSISGVCSIDGSNTCVATATMRLSYTINLSEQSGFPEQALQYGVRAVTLSKVTYWLSKNSLNTATPEVYLYVAPETAVDETDVRARLLGTVAPVPAASDKCADAIDAAGDSAAPTGTQVCRVPLDEAGRAALQTFAVDYKTPFKILVHGQKTFNAGEPVPSGTLGFSVRPTVGLAIATTL